MLPLHRPIKDKEFLNIMKKSELIKALKKQGCFMARHGKEHDKWVNPNTGASERVPRHAGEIPTGTALKILKKLVGE